MKQADRYELSICAIFQDEAPFFGEWIEFHRMLGAEHFWLYNNNSKDAYLSVLGPYIDRGIVDLEEWRTDPETPITAYQTAAYDDCLARVAGRSKWVAFIDLDEYIMPTQGQTITDVLRNYSDFAGVFLYWQMFGTSGLFDLPPGTPTIEALRLRAATNYRGNLDGKTICRPELVSHMTVHEARYAGDHFAVDLHKRRHPAGSIVTAPMRIHHYFTRTERYLREQKIPRRRRVDRRVISEDEIQRHLQKLNAVEDRTALQYAAELRRRMGRVGSAP
jgi:hypothetical protein